MVPSVERHTAGLSFRATYSVLSGAARLSLSPHILAKNKNPHAHPSHTPVHCTHTQEHVFGPPIAPGDTLPCQSMTSSSSSPPLADHLPTPPAPSSAEQGRHFLCDVTRGALFNRAPL